MRIKRIEVIGFKSFCDRAVLNFGEPVVGVVGPNGCGKSNIVDAIRWCMGEQSAKNLRGQAMGDVIFAGSDTRGPAGMAEVSLTFEDVGFSHETLKIALDSEESMNEPLPGMDVESTESAEPTLADEVAADKEVMAKLAAIAPAEEAEQPVAAPEATSVDAATLEVVEGAAEDVGEEAPKEVEVDPYQATKEAAALLADKPPVIDYAKYSEVTITRRLFRDGTSSYFLNKTPCRLRDITDFFLGSGVGTKAYSIIEQGRIGMIVSARAGDRRHIIEEAAGITKFKTKKRAAERKLDQTRQNLLRVSDIVAELAKRLGSLRRQAQKAERYRRYKGEVKDIDLWIASHRYLELSALEKTWVTELAGLQEELQNVRVNLDTHDSKVIAERADLSLEERRLSTLQEQIFELENRVRLSQSKIEFETREAAELTQRCNLAAEEIVRLKEQGAAEQSDLDRQSADFKVIDREVTAEKESANEREAALSSARESHRDATARLEDARSSLAQARADYTRSETSQESLAARVADAKTRLGRVLEETRGMDAQVKEREKHSNVHKERLAHLVQTRLDLGTKAEEFTARREELEEEVSLSEAKVETLRTEVHRRKSRLDSLREIHSKYEGFARGTRAVMQNSADLQERDDDYEIRGLVADVISAPETLEIAVEAALGDKLGGILVNKVEVGASAIQYLKDTSAGRSAFVPYMPAPAGGGIQYEDRSGMSMVPSGEGVLGAMVDLVKFEEDYKDVASNLLSEVVVVDTLKRAMELRSAGAVQTLVTLDGDIVDARGVVAGGSRDAKGASVLAQKREIRELDEIVEALERDLTEATASFVSAKSDLLKVSKAVEGLRNDRHEGELEINSHERDLAGAQSELESLRQRLARLNSEQFEIDDRVGALEHEGVIMRELHETATADMARYEELQLGLIDDVSQTLEKVDELSAVVTEAKIRVAQIGEKRASLEASVLRLTKSQEVLAGRLETLSTSSAQDRERSQTLTDDCEALSAELVGRIEEKNKLAGELDEGRRVYDQRNSDIQNAEVEVRALRSQAETISAACSEREVRLGEIHSDRRHLVESIEDRYHVALPKIVTDFHLRAQVTHEDEERLQQRRRVIERMGSDINLTAIEEFQQISERHDFLATQQKDLESALKQLDDAIQKINRTSRRLFRETFDLINNKFQEMFPKLFRGGRARLQLTGGEDVDILEAGVEIHAQPPGKKNTTVDQLSGGEKALTAVALLFSIFLIKPSPFCLLDEVDAPLDEANVDRYNEILRSMTDHSQFIVITHNKRTMAVADRLYGVTMQEPGVSKLVTVNLQKVGAKVKAA
jgi:chromosome segregation protein